MDVSWNDHLTLFLFLLNNDHLTFHLTQIINQYHIILGNKNNFRGEKKKQFGNKKHQPNRDKINIFKVKEDLIFFI